MALRAPQLLLWDAPSFPRKWEGAAWSVFGAIATCTLSILACFATDAFTTE